MSPAEPDGRRPNPIARYEDWPAAVRSAEPYVGAEAGATALGRVLGLRRQPERPTVHEEGSQRLDGVVIRRLRWSVGYGPDTSAWLLRPEGLAAAARHSRHALSRRRTLCRRRAAGRPRCRLKPAGSLAT